LIELLLLESLLKLFEIHLFESNSTFEICINSNEQEAIN
jgi:hypothetical protein